LREGKLVSGQDRRPLQERAIAKVRRADLQEFQPSDELESWKIERPKRALRRGAIVTPNSSAASSVWPPIGSTAPLLVSHRGGIINHFKEFLRRSPTGLGRWRAEFRSAG